MSENKLIDGLQDIPQKNEPMTFTFPNPVKLEGRYCPWPNERGARKGLPCGEKIFEEKNEFCSGHMGLLEKRERKGVKVEVKKAPEPSVSFEDLIPNGDKIEDLTDLEEYELSTDEDMDITVNRKLKTIRLRLGKLNFLFH